MKRLSALLCALLAVPFAALADEAVEREMQKDVVLRALVDELERSISGLEIEGLERPYFIEYAVSDTVSGWASAKLGAITDKNTGPSRTLRTDVRVGSYELDNTNFSAGFGGRRGRFGPRSSGGQLPVEDDYDAIRQGIWWATDRDYKSEIENYVRKKAFMEGAVIEDKPNDFSHETPIVHFDERLEMSIDQGWLEETAIALSAIFRDYPDIKDSDVTVLAAGGNIYLVNTEGTRLRMDGTRFAVGVTASVQADDGMELADDLTIIVRERADMPTMEELTRRCREMIERLIAVKNAPVLDEAYAGPVLFDAPAAAHLFENNFAGRFGGGQRPVGSRTSPDDFANKLNRRILPRFVNVVDDPTLERIGDVPAMGYYVYDGQGVPAQRVVLVEGGRLKAMLMSRNPSKECDKSNGHGRGFSRPSASVGSLIVTAEDASSDAELKAELLEACEDEGLAYGVRVEALTGSDPLVMYKVYADGHEELVRGAEIASFDLPAFKRIIAMGDTPYVVNGGGQAGGRTIAAPAMLFEELDLAGIDRDFDKPPILKTPLARDAAP